MMALKVPAFDYLISNYRWMFICFYLLPVSVFYEICLIIKNWLTFKFYSAPREHKNKIKNIQRQVQQWIKSGKKAPLCGSRIASYEGCDATVYRNIQMNLIDILKINSEKKTVKVQPFVTMGQLTSALLSRGWTIPVIPGVDDLTVGGLILETGLDSSSHKYGFFHNTCVSYEMVLSDGSLVKCSEEKNPDLFYSIPWSHGTLGFLTAVKIRLIPACTYVKLEYQAFHNDEIAVGNFLKECSNSENDFVEGLLYSENQCIVITGKMVDKIQQSKLNEIGKWYKPWFFQHAKNYFAKGSGAEYIPLKDYYYRHKRSTSWEVQDVVPFGNNSLFRLFFGWAIRPNLSLFKLTSSELMKKLYKDQQLMLDVLIPKDKISLAIKTFDRKLGVYPTWLCPVMLRNHPGLVHSNKPNELYINAGIYGIPKALKYQAADSLREIEAFVKDLKGFKILNGGTLMSEEEFREQYDHSLYDMMRQKLDCQEAFPTVFQKVSSINILSMPARK